MRSPFVRRKIHEFAVAALLQEVNGANEAAMKSRNEAAQWQVEYRKIRTGIVDIATHPGATPQIKAALAHFTSFRP